MLELLKQNKKYVLLALAALTVAIGLSVYVHYTNRHPSTDDAYINAAIIQINAQVNGQVKQVYVADHQYVSKGALLFSLDPKPFLLKCEHAQANLLNTKQHVRAAIDERNAARATLAQAKANWVLAKTTFLRYQKLYAKHYLARQTLDEQKNKLLSTKAAFANAQQRLQEATDTIGTDATGNARIALAQSALDQANLDLAYTKVYAPTSGRIAQLSLRKGDSVAALQTVFSLIDTKQVWIDAHFKETQVGQMRLNMPVKISVDMYPRKTFEGTIESIAYGSGDSFSILPSQNDSGNWVKVTQRFTVKIKIPNPDAHYPLRVGSSATVKVDL